jgi:hypothetical protein
MAPAILQTPNTISDHHFLELRVNSRSEAVRAVGETGRQSIAIAFIGLSCCHLLQIW